ncbi:hypothetical protein D9X30_3704 [Cupriavidus sp. U2]|uniref:hypothetical protein n=1 Tax=Burkholderiaceae TaxID=119060 RepID=UPI000491231E|nr:MULTISPECIES: hypothetical protein [Burkholderiaceae]KAI3591306.1 hypothetical protein D9X30_3704 [Cupriavidus sp. U2]
MKQALLTIMPMCVTAGRSLGCIPTVHALVVLAEGVRIDGEIGAQHVALVQIQPSALAAFDDRLSHCVPQPSLAPLTVA